MKSPQEIERQLEQVGRAWPADASIVDRVIDRIERDGVHPQPPGRKRSRFGSLLALAASLAAAAGIWWMIEPVDNSLYAQVLRAMESARTIHTVMSVTPVDREGERVAIESWFERGVGFRVNLPSEVRLANRHQKTSWTYRKKDKLAVRSDSPDIDEAIDAELDLKGRLEDLQQDGLKRHPQADATIDGRPAEAYLVTFPPPPPGYPGKVDRRRAIVLLDDQLRIVRSEGQVNVDGKWTTNIVAKWEYDVPIDRKLFEPDFGEDVKVVDADAAWRNFVDLDKALYREDRRGIIFAIHRLERFDEHGVLVASSVRAAPEVLKKYPLKQRTLGPGLYHVDGPARNLSISPSGGGYYRIELASVSYGGIDVCWWVLVPSGTNAPPYELEPGKVKLPVGYTPVGWTDYGKTFVDEQGVLQHETWDAVVELPQAAATPSLNQIADAVYADMSLLVGLPFRHLYLGTKPGTNTRDFSSPDKTTAAEYRAGTRRNVIEWYERALDFQLNGQFTEEVRRQAAAWAGTPAIGVSYNPLVDDFTLAEIAKRTSIERLYLDGTRITDAGLRELAPLKNLRKLSLNNTSITDAGLEHLAPLTTLEELSVHGTNVTPAGIAKLVRAIPGLKVSD